jgi:hypothetical protein
MRLYPHSGPGESDDSLLKCGWFLALLCTVAMSGCVSRAKAKAQAEAAFIAGQQQALAQMRQNSAQGAVVTLNGPVRQSVLPWTQNMTLGSALVAADYFGPEPTSIVIAREGRAMQVDPKLLLQGKDVQLLAGDVIQIQAGPARP